MSKVKDVLSVIVAWLFPSSYQVDVSPFLYETVLTPDLEIGDYLVATGGYIQRISAPDVYTGERTLVTRVGSNPPTTVVANEGDEWAVRVYNPEHVGE